jgi:hypothetical protein
LLRQSMKAREYMLSSPTTSFLPGSPSYFSLSYPKGLGWSYGLFNNLISVRMMIIE